MKKILLIIGLVFSLVAPQVWGADIDFYDASDSFAKTTYSSWAALSAAETPTDDDIIDCLYNTHNEAVNMSTYSGTTGHPIVLKDGVLANIAALSSGIDTNQSSYLTILNMTISDYATRGVYTGGSADTGIVINNVQIDNCNTNMYINADTGVDIDNVVLTNSASNSLLFSNSSGTLNNIQIFNSGSRGLDLSGSGGNDDAIVEDLFINMTSDVGVRINAMNSVSITNFIIENTGANSVSVNSTTGVTLSNGSVLNSEVDAYRLQSGSNNSVVTDSYAGGNLSDGFSVDATTGVEIHRCIADLNGTASAISGTGDGFTGHTGCTGLKLHFNVSRNNLNDGIGVVDTAAGEVYHHTSINDGAPIVGAARAGMWFSGTGAWTIKNSISLHIFGYPVIEIPSVASMGGLNCDYNAYISNITTAFTCGASTEQTFSQFITYVQTNGASATNGANSWFIHEDVETGTWKVYHGSAPTTLERTLTYRPVTIEGKLVENSDNPLLQGGLTITGVNDSSSFSDAWGNAVRGTPNIGSHQRGVLAGGGGNIISIGAKIGIQ